MANHVITSPVSLAESQTLEVKKRDWRWQLSHRVRTVEELSQYIHVDSRRASEIQKASRQFWWAVTPYYASLMDPEDPNCPIQRQVIPSIEESRDTTGVEDPLSEERDSPVPSIIRRYPDRLAFYVTNQCATICRFCTRKRRTGRNNKRIPPNQLEQGIRYIESHKEIRDVLITGGDPLTISDDQLEDIISRVRAIKHVEIIRIGTRTPVTLPQRITSDLCRMLEKYHPLWINVHFNHPKEITKEAAEACDRLTRAGIPLGNQSVLLKGVNDSPEVMKKLVHELLKIRVRPYYIFQCNFIKGTEHFRTPISVGIEIMERLRGHTSGLAVPTYVINAPGGGGKIPVAPTYLISQSEDEIVLRNYKMQVFRYKVKKA